MRIYLSVFLVLAVSITVCTSNTVTDPEWTSYKNFYLKSYANPTEESNARYYYAVNKDKIATHNARADKGLESYRLGINQFTDLRFIDFAALFPPTTEIPSHGVAFTVPNTAPDTSFTYAQLGFSSPVQDQGQVCNSGWAYATATTIQIYSALITGTQNSQPLSAQNFIDCAGAARSCVNQVSQVAFDYLTLYLQRVFPLSLYPNKPLIGQGPCILPTDVTNAKTLTAYSTIANGNDVALKWVVNNAAPVVIKFNPGSFEFMHYKEGVFTQPAPTKDAAHYMTVVGYGTDTTRMRDYWLVQNSFATTWGEFGFIRIERNTAKPITYSAIFPLI